MADQGGIIIGGFEGWADDVICVSEYKLFPACIFALEYLGLTKLGIVVCVSEITKYHATEGKIRNDAQQSFSVLTYMKVSRINISHPRRTVGDC
jgi:hypothetical protein